MPNVVAIVNGTNINKSDLLNAAEMLKSQLQMTGQALPNGKKDEMYRGLLDDLIATELLAQEVKARRVEVKAKEVDDFLNHFKDSFPSVQVYQNALKAQGVTEDKLKEDVRKQLGIKKLIDKELEAKGAVDDKEVRKFFDGNPEKFRDG